MYKQVNPDYLQEQCLIYEKLGNRNLDSEHCSLNNEQIDCCCCFLLFES